MSGSYNIHNFGAMIGDRVRRVAFERAMSEVITERTTVLDLGAGTGWFALHALALGAKRVVAVERLPAIRHLHALAEGHPRRDRLQIVEGDSSELDEEFDLIVSDLRGSTPFFGDHFTVAADARRRLLATDGVMMPQHDKVHVALVENQGWWRRQVEPWLDAPPVDHRVLIEQITSTPARISVSTAQLRSTAGSAIALDYAELDELAERRTHSGHAELRGRSGTAHGVAVWFSTVLINGVGFDNGPARTDPTYGRTLLPFTTPLEVAEGETIDVRIDVRRHGGSWLWQWSATAEHGNRQGASLPDPSTSGSGSSPARAAAPGIMGR